MCLIGLSTNFKLRLLLYAQTEFKTLKEDHFSSFGMLDLLTPFDLFTESLFVGKDSSSIGEEEN
jgi:hypothetical protein